MSCIELNTYTFKYYLATTQSHLTPVPHPLHDAETALTPNDFIVPLFIDEGRQVEQEIAIDARYSAGASISRRKK